MDSPPDDLIDFTLAARLGKCHVSTLHRWRLTGQLRAWKRGGRYFCSRAELLACFKPVPRPPCAPRPRIQADSVAVANAWADAVLREMGVKK